MAVHELRMSHSPSREELLAAHGALAGVSEGDVVELTLGPVSDPVGPFDYGRLMQLIVTWGRGDALPRLRVEGTIEEAVGQLLTDDHLLVAAAFADQVVAVEGIVTEQMRVAVEHALETRNSIASASSDRDDEDAFSIILPFHLPRLNHSPDLHALHGDEWAIDEEARTLYHAVWPEADKPTFIRDPWHRLGERRDEAPDGTPVIRRYDSLIGGHPRRTLSERAFEIRGLARELALRYRVRPKAPEDELGEVLFELIQNTEWHGLAPKRGRTGRAIRAFRFAEYSVEASKVDQLRDDEGPFGRYVAGLFDVASRLTQSPIEEITFGIATILDSGIGLARSAAINLHQDHLLAPDTEVNYLRMALEKSIRVSYKQMGNIGLPRVQLLMSNLLGFMTIRTGNLEIHRDFVRKPVEPSTADAPSQDLRFLDWIPENFDEFEVGPHAGTDVTLVVPLNIVTSGRTQ